MTKEEFFGVHRKYVEGHAPGRLDVMGGVADYSGSLLLTMPLRESTMVCIAERHDDTIRLHSTTAGAADMPDEIQIKLETLLEPDFRVLRKHILAIPGGAWGIYVLGCLALILQKKSIASRGADIYIDSQVPIGKGVSSSAALEVATLMALDELYKLALGKLELPVLAQKVENEIVGAPCGLMDQLTSYLGEESKLLPLVCQPIEVKEPIAIPPEIRLFGIDSGVKHSVSGKAYTNARIAAFMGYSMIAEREGVTKVDLQQAQINGSRKELPYGGYLANIPRGVFDKKYLHFLPDTISGEEFLAQYSSTIDTATEVKPDEVYAVRNCTMHPVYENDRIEHFSRLLKEWWSREDGSHTGVLKVLGSYMLESHQQYGMCGLGHQRTDELVEMVKEAGASGGVYGARVTGGGSGGTVCILADNLKGEATVQKIKQHYEAKYGCRVYLFEGSSAGGYSRRYKKG